MSRQTYTVSKKPKRRALTRDEILRTAMRIADKSGLDALSMRSLAVALKVEAMSLYNHVKNKDDLLDGLVELVVAEIAMPVAQGDQWKPVMRARAISAHEVLMRHPWATLLFVSRANIGPHMLRYVDATIGCLRAAGFSYAMADHAWNAIDAYVYGFTLQQLNFPFDPSEYAKTAKRFLPMIPVAEFPHLHGMSTAIIEGKHDGRHQLERGLDLLLDGFDQATPKRRRG